MSTRPAAADLNQTAAALSATASQGPRQNRSSRRARRSTTRVSSPACPTFSRHKCVVQRLLQRVVDRFEGLRLGAAQVRVGRTQSSVERLGCRFVVETTVLPIRLRASIRTLPLDRRAALGKGGSYRLAVVAVPPTGRTCSARCCSLSSWQQLPFRPQRLANAACACRSRCGVGTRRRGAASREPPSAAK